MLIRIIGEFKEANRVCKWSEVAKDLNSRSGRNVYRAGKQCRERWNNHLDPNVSRGPWCDKEDMDLMRLIQEKGKKWSEISKCIPTSRTENAVKNRFNSLIKKEKANLKQTKQKTNSEHLLIESIVSRLENRLKHGFTIVNQENDYENNENSCKSEDSDEEEESTENAQQLQLQMINAELPK